MIGAISYRPFEAPKKACIIDGADKLNASSGNALLKTLEASFGLPCLNHACGRHVAVMSDLFGGR